MSLLLFSFVIIFSATAQQINQIKVSPNGKSMFIDFDCRTMSHAPLQQLMVCNEGHVENFTLEINQLYVIINDQGQPLSFVPNYWRVEYGNNGALKKIVDKNTGLLMKFYYEGTKLVEVREKASKSKLCFRYDKDNLLTTISDNRHGLKMKFDYHNGQLCKLNGGNAFSSHNFVYKSEQLQKIKQHGQGTLVKFDYKNGYINRTDDRNNPIPLVIGY